MIRDNLGRCCRTDSTIDDEYQDALGSISGNISTFKEIVVSRRDGTETEDSFPEKLTSSPKQRLPPILRVPNDIICCIFESCLDQDHIPTLSHKTVPTLLTHICSSLRQIALAMPGLWAAVHISIGAVYCGRSELNTYSQEKQNIGIEEWLCRRSRGAPLRLSIRIHGNLDVVEKEDCVNVYHETMSIIFRCHSRWRDIIISGLRLDKWSIELFKSLTPNDVPGLRTFIINDYLIPRVRVSMALPPTPAIPLLGSHQLTQIGGFDFQELVTLRSSLPWSTLTFFGCSVNIFRSHIAAEVASALRQCTSLVELSIFFHGSDSELRRSGITRIEIPSLQHLDVTEEFNADISLATTIVAPKLESLTLEGQPRIPTTITSFMQNTSNITFLCLGSKMESDLYIQVLRHCPRLVHLVDCPPFTDVGIDVALAYNKVLVRLVDADGAGDILCPKLETWRIYNNIIKIIYFDTLQALILRKLQPCSPLLATWRKLHLTVNVHKEHKDAVDGLLLRCSRGQIEIRVLCY